MKTIMIRGKTYEVPDEVAEEIKRLRKSDKVIKFVLKDLSPPLARALIKEAQEDDRA